MLTLLSTLFGLLGSLLPSIVNIFQKKVDYAHELEIKRLEYDAAREGLLIQKDIADYESMVNEGESVRDHDNDIEYKGFWADVRASIRPVITYAFFILFVGIKVAAFSVMVDKGVTPSDLLILVWDSETMAIFGAIMGFWFGSRAIMKFSEIYSREIPSVPSMISPAPLPIPLPMNPINDKTTGKEIKKPAVKNKGKKKPIRPLSDK